MASIGPQPAGAGASIAGPDNNWASPGNITSSNDARASAALTAPQISDFLSATVFDFSTIPAGSTIDGIVVEVEKSQSGAGTIEDDRVFLTKDGSTLVGTNHSPGAAWTTTDAFSTYGTSTALWGTTWTLAEIQASTFGCLFGAAEGLASLATARVDFIRITVYYTAPAARSRAIILGV